MKRVDIRGISRSDDRRWALPVPIKLVPGLLVLVAATIIVGCAARGSEYRTISAEVSKAPDDSARIVFFRTRDSALYIARKARISVDGEKIGGTPYGGFHYVDVAPGPHRLRADMWDAPGRCELTLVTSPGQTYYFQVDARSESFGAFSAAGFAADLVSGGIVAGVAGGLAGSAIESYGKTCGGAFNLYPVDPETASIKLRQLKLSD